MDGPPGDQAHQPLRHRKTLDRARVLPLIGLVLLLPPVADLFQADVRLLGVPLTAVYLFTVWGFLIVATALLSHRLREAEPGASPTGTPNAP